MTPPELDEATRARIRAEEMERMKVREELAVQARQQNKPNYWMGLSRQRYEQHRCTQCSNARAVHHDSRTHQHQCIQRRANKL